jgi:hypothetical protein
MAKIRRYKVWFLNMLAIHDSAYASGRAIMWAERALNVRDT